MTLKPEGIDPVPDETARVAHAAFPHGSTAMLLREELSMLSLSALVCSFASLPRIYQLYRVRT